MTSLFSQCFDITSNFSFKLLNRANKLAGTSQDAPLSILTLLNSQIDFLRQVCFDRTQNATIFEEIRSTLTECQRMILNGTSLNYATLSVVTPTEFHEFYDGQCQDLELIEQRNDCNDQLKYLLKQCLNETENVAFEKVENVVLKLNTIVCEMDADKIKSEAESERNICGGN